MKSHDSLIRLRKFEVDERRQKVADLEMMIEDFQMMAGDLDRQVEVEQQRAGTDDVNDCRIPCGPRMPSHVVSASLTVSMSLKAKLDAARDELTSSFEELKKVEKVGEREAARHQEQLDQEEHNELDEINNSRHHHG